MSKGTYGLGTTRLLYGNTYQFRYAGQSKTMEAANKKAADIARLRWVKEIDDKAGAGPDVSINDILDEHLADMRRQGCSDAHNRELKLAKNVRPLLGKLDAKLFKVADIKRHIDRRIVAEVSNSTINQELSSLRRAFNIAIKDEVLTKMPCFDELFLPLDNVREGFVEDSVYRLLLVELPDHVKLPWCFGYHLGIRSGELLKYQWSWLDWTADPWPLITVPGVIGKTRATKQRITKNKKLRQIPVYGDMIEMTKMAYQARDQDCPYIFQRKGQQVKSFRKAFENTRERLGMESLIFHDLRRTAVRNMDMEGIPRAMAKQVTGHKTDSSYERYGIGLAKDTQQVGTRMASYHRKERQRLSEKENCGINCGTPKIEEALIEDSESKVN
jgi:integrase